MRADDKDVINNPGQSLRLRLSFLGPEFLTWLYFHLDQVGGEILVSELVPNWPSLTQKMQIGVGNQMTLKSLMSTDMRVSILASTLEERGEVLQSIREGTLIDTLSLEITLGKRTHSFVVHSLDGAIGKARTVQDFQEEDRAVVEEHAVENEQMTLETNLLLRMANMDEIEDILDGLFNRFLRRRLAQAFIKQEIGAMRQMIADGLLAKLPKLAKPATEPLRPNQEATA